MCDDVSCVTSHTMKMLSGGLRIRQLNATCIAFKCLEVKISRIEKEELTMTGEHLIRTLSMQSYSVMNLNECASLSSTGNGLVRAAGSVISVRHINSFKLVYSTRIKDINCKNAAIKSHPFVARYSNSILSC